MPAAKHPNEMSMGSIKGLMSKAGPRVGDLFQRWVDQGWNPFGAQSDGPRAMDHSNAGPLRAWASQAVSAEQGQRLLEQSGAPEFHQRLWLSEELNSVSFAAYPPPSEASLSVARWLVQCGIPTKNLGLEMILRLNRGSARALLRAGVGPEAFGAGDLAEVARVMKVIAASRDGADDLRILGSALGAERALTAFTMPVPISRHEQKSSPWADAHKNGRVLMFDAARAWGFSIDVEREMNSGMGPDGEFAPRFAQLGPWSLCERILAQAPPRQWEATLAGIWKREDCSGGAPMSETFLRELDRVGLLGRYWRGDHPTELAMPKPYLSALALCEARSLKTSMGRKGSGRALAKPSAKRI